MLNSRAWWLLAGLVGLAPAGHAAEVAAETQAAGARRVINAPYVINVIEPMSGNAAFVGHTHEAALLVLQDHINLQGGIRGRPISLAFHDDQTTPQLAVQITNEILASHPAVMLGSSIVAMCGAELPLLKRGPFTYCMSPGMRPPPGSYMFSIGVNTQTLIQVSFNYFRARGWTRIASITSTDATGQEIEQGLDAALALPGNAGLRLVERSRFNVSDVSVSAQMERIRAAAPQVVIAWSTGGAIANIFKGLIQAGVEAPVLTTTGNMANPVMEKFAGFLPKTLLVPSTTYIPHEGQYVLDPRVEARQQEFFAIATANHVPIDYMAAGVWDSLLMITDALRTLGPEASAEQVRAWLAGQTAWAGMNGLYDFTKVPQRGLEARQAIITRWDGAGGRWRSVSTPGGEQALPE